jgi:poly-gamma-glutamate synthesis protein (capsule biosynthesis protein)
LRAAVVKAKRQADVVIVMIHGGKEYDRNPTTKLSYLTEIARQAGATLVVNHHPHVVGGFSLKDQSLITWTLGSLFSDQNMWTSFESYMLAVYLREGKIIRAYVEPLIIDGFVPHGLSSEMADYVVRGAAGREAGPFIMESNAMEVDLDGQALQTTYIQNMDGGAAPGTLIPIPQAQWISDFKGTGKLSLGRDLLWVGSFENDEVDSTSYGAPLWDLNLGNVKVGQDFAYEGKIGIRLAKGASGTSDAVTTNLHRISVAPLSKLSITGMVRIVPGGAALAQLSWYQSAIGPSFSKDTHPIEVQADSMWQSFRIDVQVPSNAVALGLYFRLPPPVQGTVSADFDNIRIIEWAGSQARYSPLYNYALLTGAGNVTFAQEILPGAEQWVLPPADPNK